ncbi:MAG TPA: MFS transporter [Gemmatimonadaceae bacterium]|jgi:MFS family permease|nr:MFS transporter [Gemmatimonadaceae bacterium]
MAAVPDSTLTRAALLLVGSLTIMSGATIAPALPAMQAHFSVMGVDGAGLLVRLVLTLPSLLVVIAAPLAGLIVDRGGRRRLLVAAMLLYALAGSSGLYLDSLGAILLGRALLGVAVAGVMTSATTLAADYYAGPARARFMGWQSAFMSLGGVVFLTGGGALAEVGWRLPFLVYLVALPLALLARRTLLEPARGPGSAASRASGAVARNAASAIRPAAADALPARTLASLYGMALLGMTAFYLIPSQIPFHLAALVDAGPTASGGAIATSTLASAATALAYGRIRARFAFPTILALSFTLVGLGLIAVSLSASYAAVLAGLAVCGLGMGTLTPNLNVWLASTVPAALRGRALGGLSAALFLGGFVSPLVSQPLADVIGLGATFGATGVVLVAGALTLLLASRIHSRGRRETPGTASAPNSLPAAGTS